MTKPNLLVVANTHFPLLNGNYMGGIETVICETLLNQDFCSQFNKVVLLDTMDSDFKPPYENVIVDHYLSDSSWKMKKEVIEKGILGSTGKPKRVSFRFVSTDLTSVVEKHQIDVIWNNCPRDSVLLTACRTGLPVLHFLHQAAASHFEWHLYKSFHEIKKQFSNLTVASVSNNVQKLVNAQFEGLSDIVINPCVSDLAPSQEERTKEAVLVARVDSHYKTKEAVRLAVSLGLSIDLIGTINDPTYLEEILAEFGDKVNHLGQLTRADLFAVLPKYKYNFTFTDWEAYGLAILEQAQLGLKIIPIGNPDMTGVSDSFNNFKTVLPSKNYQEMIDQAKEIIEGDFNVLKQDKKTSNWVSELTNILRSK